MVLNIEIPEAVAQQRTQDQTGYPQPPHTQTTTTTTPAKQVIGSSHNNMQQHHAEPNQHVIPHADPTPPKLQQ